MTGFTTIANATFLQDKPILGSTGVALRDNAISIGEADVSVPLNLLPTVLLGTLATTSGSTQTLSGLVLTPYKFLTIVLDNVGPSGGSPPAFDILLGGVVVVTGPPRTAVLTTLELSSGFAFSGSSFLGATSYSTATTALVFTITGGVFAVGSIRVYGGK